MFDFSFLQKMYGGMPEQQPSPMGLLQPYNPYGMGIPTQPQAAPPYTQQSPYTSGTPYTQTGTNSPPLPQGLPSFQDYFNPFQDLRQQWQDQNAADYMASLQPPVAAPVQETQQYWVPTSGWGDSPGWWVLQRYPGNC